MLNIEEALEYVKTNKQNKNNKLTKIEGENLRPDSLIRREIKIDKFFDKAEIYE